jgi:TP901 family phage tail tape measure protein
MQNRVNKMTRSIDSGLRSANRNLDKFTQGMKKAAAVVAIGAGLVTGAMGNVIMTGADFEQTLVNAAAKFPGEVRKGTASFKMLEDAARKAGATTEFTSSQAAQALNFLAMAGFDAQQSVAALPQVIDLATAAQVDLATASDIATDALGAFGLATKDPIKLTENLSRVNDVLAKTAVTANTTVEQLFESMKKSGPIATAAGVQIETVAALIGTMANSGIKAERAGTAVANMFLNLTTPASRAQKVMKSLGISVLDSHKNLKDMPIILGELQKKLAPLSKAKRLTVLESIFGREGLAGATAVINGGAKAFEDYRKRLIEANGASKTMASVMRDTLQGRLNSLKSAIEGVKISIFSMNEGPLSDVVDRMTQWVRANGDLIASKVGEYLLYVINNIDSIVSGLKAIGIAMGVFLAFTTILKTFVLTMTAVNLVMAMNPVGLLVLGITALIAAFTALVVWIDDISAGFDKLPGIVKAVLFPINLLIKSIKWVKDNIGGITDKVASFLGFGGKITKPTFGMELPGGKVEEIDMSPYESSNTRPQMVSPQERIARNIEERKTSAEITINDKTGRAEVNNNTMGSSLKMQPTGGL